MLKDILNEIQSVSVENKEYRFVFDHAAFASLEKQTGKSIYEFYDNLLCKNNILYLDVCAIVGAGLLRNHTTEEILELQNLLQDKPGLWHNIKEAVITAFIVPMLPPEILLNRKKKVRGKSKKNSKK